MTGISTYANRKSVEGFIHWDATSARNKPFPPSSAIAFEGFFLLEGRFCSFQAFSTLFYFLQFATDYLATIVLLAQRNNNSGPIYLKKVFQSWRNDSHERLKCPQRLELTAVKGGPLKTNEAIRSRQPKSPRAMGTNRISEFVTHRKIKKRPGEKKLAANSRNFAG